MHDRDRREVVLSAEGKAMAIAEKFVPGLLDFILHRHAMHEWEHLTGFYALFGFTAYLAIVFGANLLRKLVGRKEDYYDVDE